LPKPAREPIWLEPFPDELLADEHSDPQERALSRERITLAFLVALQHLTPVQRAVLLLREVLEWPTVDVAEWLHLSVPAVKSALQRARRALRQRHAGREANTPRSGLQEQALLDRYLALWEQADIPGIVALLREDAWFTMPPLPLWVQGRAAIAALFQTPLFTAARYRHLLQTRANGSPAFGIYRWDAEAGVYQLFGLVVLDVAGEQIAHLVAFLDPESFSSFALPPTLPPKHSSTTDGDFAVGEQEPISDGEVNR
jgi:RNA polymerase sigma-70 factor (ECF subfamily)